MALLTFVRAGALRIAASALLLAAAAEGAEKPRAAEEVKAAFVCNFADFVEWPPAPDSPAATVTIGILGEDPFGQLIDEAASARSVPGRKLEVLRLDKEEAAADVQILFVGASEEENLAAILEAVRGLPVLTVGDLPGFASRGGVIGLLVEDKRVRLEINVAAAHRAGLAISSRLLKLARLVEDAAPPPAAIGPPAIEVQPPPLAGGSA